PPPKPMLHRSPRCLLSLQARIVLRLCAPLVAPFALLFFVPFVPVCRPLAENQRALGRRLALTLAASDEQQDERAQKPLRISHSSLAGLARSMPRAPDLRQLRHIYRTAAYFTARACCLVRPATTLPKPSAAIEPARRRRVLRPRLRRLRPRP